MSNITTDDGDRRKKRAVWVTERELDRLKTQAERPLGLDNSLSALCLTGVYSSSKAKAHGLQPWEEVKRYRSGRNKKSGSALTTRLMTRSTVCSTPTRTCEASR